MKGCFKTIAHAVISQFNAPERLETAINYLRRPTPCDIYLIVDFLTMKQSFQSDSAGSNHCSVDHRVVTVVSFGPEEEIMVCEF